MYYYKKFVGNLWAVYKDGHPVKAYESEIHAKLFCNNLNK